MEVFGIGFLILSNLEWCGSVVRPSAWLGMQSHLVLRKAHANIMAKRMASFRENASFARTMLWHADMTQQRELVAVSTVSKGVRFWPPAAPQTSEWVVGAVAIDAVMSRMVSGLA